MNPKSLEALVMDRCLGELSPEAEELLDAYLEVRPDSRKLAAGVAEAIAVAGMAVTDSPEFFAGQDPENDHPAKREETNVPAPRWVWMNAAAAIALLFAAGIGGYLAGSRSDSSRLSASFPEKDSTSLFSNPSPGPWARYRIASGGIEASLPTPTPTPKPRP